MELYRRFPTALFCLVLLSWDPSFLARVAADPDFNPTANLETIRSCSLIIPMSRTLQGVGTSAFNYKAYVRSSRVTKSVFCFAPIPVFTASHLFIFPCRLTNAFSSTVMVLSITSCGQISQLNGLLEQARTHGFNLWRLCVRSSILPPS